MRVHARLTSFTTMAVAIAVLAPMAPASAVPTPVGEWVSESNRVLRTVVADECRDVVEAKVSVDLQGIGNAIEAQGYYDQDKDPVYTNLNWNLDYRVTGPANFYATGTRNYNFFPAGELTYTIQVCPDDFSADAVVPGVFTLETHVVVNNDFYKSGNICSAAEGCRSYPKLYEKTLASTFTLVGEAPPPPSADCVDATAAVAKFTPLVKKAKALLKKAKATHKSVKIRKAKRRLVTYKGKLAVARDRVIQYC